MPKKEANETTTTGETGLNRDHWPDISLAYIFMFRDYLDHAFKLKRAYDWGSDVHPSFRGYVDKNTPVKTHRHLTKIVDRLEHRLGRMLIARDFLDDKGREWAVTTTKRLDDLPFRPDRNGAPTEDAAAFHQFALLVEDLWDSLRSGLPATTLSEEIEALRSQFSEARSRRASAAVTPEPEAEIDPDEDT